MIRDSRPKPSCIRPPKSRDKIVARKEIKSGSLHMTYATSRDTYFVSKPRAKTKKPKPQKSNLCYHQSPSGQNKEARIIESDNYKQSRILNSFHLFPLITGKAFYEHFLKFVVWLSPKLEVFLNTTFTRDHAS